MIPKIADFGLAKQVDDDSSQTKSGTILGTPSYMAPEQASGKNREIGPAADIYSLGAIFYELLVGRPPFRAGNPIDTIRQVVDQEPVPPRQLEPRVPLDLETICLKCLEKDPARRYGSSLELADDLRRFIEGHPIQARPDSGLGARLEVGPAPQGRRGAPGRHRHGDPGRRAVRRLAQCLAARQARRRPHPGAAGAAARARRSSAKNSWPSCCKRPKGSLTARGSPSPPAIGRRRGSTSKRRSPPSATESRLDSVKEPALALLKQVENELRIESDRKASRARLQTFGKLRDEAQFLGTLYTGMDLAANLQAARASVAAGTGGLPGHARADDAPAQVRRHLTDAQKAEIKADCAQLLLILAETEAQSTASAGQKPTERDQFLKKALAYLEESRRLGAPERAFHLRRARYLRMLGDADQAAQAETAAQAAASDDVLDHFLMADELYRRERFGEAIQEFDRVLERKPGHFWAQYLNALCLLRQQRPAEARALLERLPGPAIRLRLAVLAPRLRSTGAQGVGRRPGRLSKSRAVAAG